jgi:SAM-dependent methyltransferase
MISPSLIKSALRKAGLIKQNPAETIISESWSRMQESLSTANRLIDLGSGAHPHPRASVAVDAFLKPIQRNLGRGPEISSETFREKGVHFLQADLAALPFADKAFDFAYSHHVFEHLVDPRKACSEMCRIAERGAIVTPSIFAEIAFGRPYHRWFVIARGDTLIFIRKMPQENQPFGKLPLPKKGGGYKVTKQTNPFDILLNEGGWYHGRERMGRLSRLLRHFRYSHSPIHNVVFLWEENFNCLVIHEDGKIES